MRGNTALVFLAFAIQFFFEITMAQESYYLNDFEVSQYDDIEGLRELRSRGGKSYSSSKSKSYSSSTVIVAGGYYGGYNSYYGSSDEDASGGGIFVAIVLGVAILAVVIYYLVKYIRKKKSKHKITTEADIEK